MSHIVVSYHVCKLTNPVSWEVNNRHSRFASPFSSPHGLNETEKASTTSFSFDLERHPAPATAIARQRSASRQIVNARQNPRTREIVPTISIGPDRCVLGIPSMPWTGPVADPASSELLPSTSSSTDYSVRILHYSPNLRPISSFVPQARRRVPVSERRQAGGPSSRQSSPARPVESGRSDPYRRFTTTTTTITHDYSPSYDYYFSYYPCGRIPTVTGPGRIDFLESRH
ncbi:hypothetical protein B2J93_2510 [Marssonina coronariae]|uniref:Uncharacterized protein n=1 Tax=Diplocarpon coronariae TaxID=2795749 RepID=A0A218ZEV2_9HELO|nr:hypothetical protein B2J93_2510 [Marssonina coronariae]